MSHSLHKSELKADPDRRSFTLSHRLGRGTFLVRVKSYPEQRDVTASECTAGGCASATEMILGLQAAPGTIHIRSAGRR